MGCFVECRGTSHDSCGWVGSWKRPSEGQLRRETEDLGLVILLLLERKGKIEGHGGGAELRDVDPDPCADTDAVLLETRRVVHCAGIVGPNATKITDVDVEDFDKVYRVNLRGSFSVTKYALQRME